MADFAFFIGAGFQVISRRKLKGNDPQNYERLQQGLAKVKKWEQENKSKLNSSSASQRYQIYYVCSYHNLCL